MIASRSAARLSRRTFIQRATALGAAAVLSGCASTPAPTTRKPFRVGWLNPGIGRSDAGGRLRDALEEIGYVEGRDFIIELAYAENVPDRLPELASELVRRKVDIIVPSGEDALRAARDATSSTPIVFRGVGDLIGQGILSSLARPGGNVTGTTSFLEIGSKGFELLRSLVPGLTRIAKLYNPALTAHLNLIRSEEKIARELDIQLILVPVSVMDELIPRLESAVRDRPQALASALGVSFFGGGPTDRAFVEKFGLLLDFVVREKLPLVFGEVDAVRAGGLVSIGGNNAQGWRLVAYQIDKVVRGANPGDLPVLANNVFDIALNLGMARKIGLTIPAAVLRDATEVIP